MRTFYQILLFIIFYSFDIITAQVAIDSTSIRTFFYGPFNKTIVEIFLYNLSNRDSLSANVKIQINKTAFIKNLYLDINGELKKASTLEKRTGQEIYTRIVYKKIDPALLIKTDEGEYTLSVYPFLGYQRRKVVIEYYSVLESDSSNYPGWSFNISPTNANYRGKLHFKSYQEKTVHIFSLGQKVLTEIKNEKVETEIRQIDIESLTTMNSWNFYFDYSILKIIPVYSLDSIKFFQVFNSPFKSNYSVKYSKNTYLPDFISRVLTDLNKNKRSIVIYSGENQFLNKFLEYLKTQDITCLKGVESGDNNLILDNFNWSKENDVYRYLDKSLTLLQANPMIKLKTVNLNCPFLDQFINYLSSLEQNEADQIKAGFLNSNLSKIVIEKDQRANNIWSEVVKKKGELVGDPVYFVAVEEMPVPIGGMDTIKHSVFIPRNIKFEKDSFKVYLLGFIHKTGHSVDIRIIKGVKISPWQASVIDRISMFAGCLPNWKPGIQRGKPISVLVSIPIVFNPEIFSQRNSKEIGGREFITVIKDSAKLLLLEKKFENRKSRIIKFLSTQYFELMKENPELIELSYKALYLSKFDGFGVIVFEGRENKNYIIIR